MATRSFTLPLPEFVQTIARTLNENGKEAHLVGGAVRDTLLGKTPFEYDMATNAHPDEITRIFKRTVPVGIRHGTVLVLIGDNQAEVTTYRADGTYTDGRRPDSVTYARSIEDDLSRRDFTVNAMAYNIKEHVLTDLFEGERDLAQKIIRTVGNADKRFAEDGLRVMRACRFAAQLGFDIDKETLSAIPKAIPTFAKVSAERVREELNGILKSDNLFRGIELMRESGLLALVIPELYEGYGIEQNRFHAYDVYYHNLYTAQAVEPCDTEEETMLLRMACLLHDIGKTPVKKKVPDQEDNVFYNHEIVGAAMARTFMRRLKYSNAEIAYVDNMVRNHMFYYRDEWTDGAVRRFMRNVGAENITSLLKLREADRIGNGKKRAGESEPIKRLLRRIERVIEEENAIKVTDLAINGTDIMELFAVSPGPLIGKTLNALLEIILDEPKMNERDALIECARAYLKAEGAIA